MVGDCDRCGHSVMSRAWALLSDDVRAGIRAAAEAPEEGSAEEWESPGDAAERMTSALRYHETFRFDHIIKAHVDRDAAWLTALRRTLDEPDADMRRLLLAHVERVSR